MLTPMKESWFYYDYLRRWWWMLLLISTIGFVGGLIYSNAKVYPVTFDATATIAIEEPGKLPDFFPVVLVSVQTTDAKDAAAAIDSAGATISRLGRYSGAPFTIQDFGVTRSGDNSRWLKSSVLGTVIGMLVAIGGIYVFEDALSYRRHRLDGRLPGVNSNGHPAPGAVPLPKVTAGVRDQILTHRGR